MRASHIIRNHEGMHEQIRGVGDSTLRGWVRVRVRWRTEQNKTINRILSNQPTGGARMATNTHARPKLKLANAIKRQEKTEKRKEEE